MDGGALLSPVEPCVCFVFDKLVYSVLCRTKVVFHDCNQNFFLYEYLPIYVITGLVDLLR